MAIFLNAPRVSNAQLRLDDLTDAEVLSTTRFPRYAVDELCELLHDDLVRPTRRSRALPVDTQVLTALHFYSTGSFQWMVGRGTGLSQPAVSKVVDGVTQALCKLAKVAICFPTSQQQLTANKLAFHGIAGFPNVIGCIDGTHVRIKAPSEAEDAYVNRKGVHTINVQAVCDAEMKITNVVAKWPGSAHDAFIWRSSSLHYLFENGHIQGGWLLGTLSLFFYALLRHNKTT